MEDKRDPRIPELRRQPIPYAPPLKLHPAPDCDDQLPVFSRVGRGIKGDSVDVDLVVDDDGHTHLVVDVIDQADGHIIEHHDKIIDGGKLTYGYNLHPFNDPSTFTITFHYDHPSEDPDLDWSWTTPEIPYMWSHEGADEIVGSGIASLFIRKKGEEWYRTGPDHLIPTSHTTSEAVLRQEKLIYPEGDTVAENRYYYNAPDPDDPEKKWTVNLTYGISTEDDPTDIDVPSREDLAKIIGVDPDFIERLVNERDLDDLEGITFGENADHEPINTKEYIDGVVDDLSDHIHQDMGFDDILVNDGDADTQTPKRNTIKKWFDWIIGKLGFGNLIDNLGDASTIKEYIDAIPASISDPKLYRQTYDIDLCFYETKDWTADAGDFLFFNIIQRAPLATKQATLTVSYFDTLPQMEIAIQINVNQGDYHLAPSVVGIACERGVTPRRMFNLAGRTLPHRPGLVRAPLLNPEKLSNCGFNPDSSDPNHENQGTWQIYTGIGDLKCVAANDTQWPWGYNSERAVPYLINRRSEFNTTTVTINYYRIYDCSYNQATLG